MTIYGWLKSLSVVVPIGPVTVTLVTHNLRHIETSIDSYSLDVARVIMRSSSRPEFCLAQSVVQLDTVTLQAYTSLQSVLSKVELYNVLYTSAIEKFRISLPKIKLLFNIMKRV